MHEPHDTPCASGPPAFEWDDIYTGTAQDLQPPDPLMRDMIAALPPGRALDVGCGGGGMVAALAELGWEASGLDIAPKAIAGARLALEQRGLSATLYVADAAAWTAPQQYELIVSSFALPGDVPARVRAFGMMREALTPGGVVLLKDFDDGMTPSGLFAGFDLVTLDELRAAFDGFEVLRAEVVATPVHDHDGTGSHAGEHWTAALFHARKPQ